MKTYETKSGPVPADRLSVSVRRKVEAVLSGQYDLRKKENRDIADAMRAAERIAEQLSEA